ncbi:CENPC protein, partial [Alcedo cyanopectus]|nr:CENPC protein [Ceyx cyanopectus]
LGKTTKDAVRQGSPNQKVDLFWKPDSGEKEMAVLGSQTKASHAKQSKTRVVPSKDSPVPSPELQQQQTPKKTPKSSKNLQLVSKASQSLASKKKTAQQKLPKDPVAKRLAQTPRKKLKTSAKKSSNRKAQLPREESSDSDPGAEEPQRAVTLTEAFTLPQQKSQPGANQKSTQSLKLDSVLQQLGSLGAGNKSFVKVLECLMDSMKKSEKKQLPAQSAGETPQNVHPRRSEGVCSNHEDVESAGDSDSSSVHGVARKKQKLSAGKRKREKRKHGRQLHGPVLEHDDQLSSRSKFSEENHMSSGNVYHWCLLIISPVFSPCQLVMPSNTPNVRRTKRVRVKPLEYWRGERINYTVSSSGLVFSGIVCPETKPHRKTEQRRNGHKKKINEASKIPADLDLTLADASKPTIVLDPITNKEVLLKCVSTDMRHDCFFKDEAVEIYKTLNTSAFATGKLILKPLKEKGRQFVHMDTIAFHVIQGRVIFTLHETSYYLTTGSCFYVPAGNEYNIRNILNEESVLFFTQLK